MSMKQTWTSLWALLAICFFSADGLSAAAPLKIGVIGLTHSHVHWILGRPDRGDITIVGIVEPNRDLATRFLKQHELSMDLHFESAEAMLAKVKPDGVTAFNSIYEHLEVVKTFAPLGVHVLVEKPMAVSAAHAREMVMLARQHGIHLLTNYETTWYPTNHRAYEIVHEDQSIGPIRKIVVHDGHRGPEEIGVNQEFLDWLIDPIRNGGGAITDFGCYGVNLINWLTRGARPLTVTAVTQTIKPHKYPKVDDEATIILTYPEMQGIIQASWNWPISRKDMEVYGRTGQVIAKNRHDLEIRHGDQHPVEKFKLKELEDPRDDPFAYFAAVINGEIKLGPHDLSAPENNLLVNEILEAAIRSARTGMTVPFDPR
jgi:predicted dehydrogenase